MSTNYFFAEPLDVLMVRGNKFSAATASMVKRSCRRGHPGAFRFALLRNDAQMLSRFVSVGSDKALSMDARNSQMRNFRGNALFAALGTPSERGDFRVTWLSPAMIAHDTSSKGNPPSRLAAIMPLPADLIAFLSKTTTIKTL